MDAVVTGRAAALPWAAAVLAGAGARLLGRAGRRGAVMMATVGQRGLAEMREEVFGAAVAQPPEAVERAGTGDLVSRVSDDVEAVNTAIVQDPADLRLRPVSRWRSPWEAWD